MFTLTNLPHPGPLPEGQGDLIESERLFQRGIKDADLFPEWFAFLDEFQVARMCLVRVLVGGRGENEVQGHVVIAIVYFSIVFGGVHADAEVDDAVVLVQMLLAAGDELGPVGVVGFGEREEDDVGQWGGFFCGHDVGIPVSRSELVNGHCDKCIVGAKVSHKLVTVDDAERRRIAFPRGA